MHLRHKRAPLFATESLDNRDVTQVTDHGFFSLSKKILSRDLTQVNLDGSILLQRYLRSTDIIG